MQVSWMEEVNEELLSLPDDLLTLLEDDSGTTSNSLDYSSQNGTAAAPELPGGSSPETQQPEILIQIKNVVSTVKLGCPLDLHFIARNAWNVEYNPQVFNRLIMRIRKPPTTGIFFETGSLFCFGATSEEQSRLAARRFSRIVQKLGFPVRFLDFKIHNIMAKSKTFPVRLEQLAHRQSCSYEPELFLGLLYKRIPGISVTIYSSGTLWLCGN
ncbi:TATA box-binding protein-like 2 [Cebidichthys violaceus]|uniref:TATA box-binding protein-like 2 n=1 Tax=Cebidichthys violaceus TaxID=271503 RepID=UPI0035C959A7